MLSWNDAMLWKKTQNTYDNLTNMNDYQIMYCEK
jgi:hypothetical protein